MHNVHKVALDPEVTLAVEEEVGTHGGGPLTVDHHAGFDNALNGHEQGFRFSLGVRHAHT